MIGAMPAVAVRRERKKQRAAAARQGSLSSLPSPSTRSSSLLSSPLSAPPGSCYNYFAAQRPASRRPSCVSAPAGAPPSRRPSASGVSTISSAASNYVSALHRVRERQLETQRERARFLVYTGSVLAASGAALLLIGLWARAGAPQTVGLLFLALGAAFCLARVFCLQQPPPLPRRASGHSIYAPSHSAATTPGADDSSTTSSYYFAALRRPPPPLSSPDAPTSAALPPLRPPPPVVPGGVRGSHRSNNPILTPMSLDSIPEMQVLITDDSQRY